MANADKGNIEVINGSIGDLIFRIETLTSDRDTIKVCVRAANELAAMQSTIARLTAAHEMQGESLVVLPRWMVSNMEDKMKAQAEDIRKLKQALNKYSQMIECLPKDDIGGGIAALVKYCKNLAGDQ